jgi:S-DNA-T family DNA segregation ATPase FtsK/SpoIIIE
MRMHRPNPLTRAQKQEVAGETRRKLGAANGRSLVAPGEPGERDSVVPREFLTGARAVPDAPRARVRRKDGPHTDRYFTVEDFREIKKIGKREDGLPALELLSDLELNQPTEEEINNNARIIKNTLLEFDVEVDVIDVKVGPTVTQYAVSPYTEMVTDEGETVLNRVRVSQIANLSGDLALALSAKRLRIQAPVPGHSYVGVEVPNRQPSTVALRPVLESEAFYRYRKRPLVLPLGRDVSGDAFITDLGTMPHLLVAGTTGSGKSIMLAAMTTALVMHNPPDRVKLVLLDPKMVELSRFNGLPHLMGPVETELDRIIEVLRWATREMDIRYKLLEKEAARNIETFNNSLGRRRQSERLPYIVIIVDEIGDMMMQRPDETERALTRLAQMARAVGIHLLVATQRPSVDVITGLIKANFPARISFAVASGVDSRVILDTTGAESLVGRGDMLFLAPDASGPQRIQGCYISDEEVNTVVAYWKQWHTREIKAGRVEPPSVAPWERGLTRREVLSETDPMLEEAITLVVAEGEASASLIQRRLGLGYPRAARLMDLMQELGVVGAARPGGRTREVLVKPGADPFRKLVENRLKDRQ